MSTSHSTVWKDIPTAGQLAMVLTTINDQTVMENFLRDSMTRKEITEIAARLEAARMLRAGATYGEIIEKTKLSSRTVARISDWLKHGCKGYETALAIIESHTR